MLDPPTKTLRFLLLLGILSTAASTSKQSSIEDFNFDDYDDNSLNEILSEKFSCEGRPYGYYADQEQDCKVFHICSPVESSSGRHVKSLMYSFNCPETTIFSQDSRTCITEKYALPCRRAHTLYSLNKSIGQITPKGAKKHVPGFTSGSNLHSSNTISEDTGATPKPTLPSIPSQRFSSANSAYKPTVRGSSQTSSTFDNTSNKLSTAKKETLVDKSLNLKLNVGSTTVEKSDAKAINNFKETLQTDGKSTENVKKEPSFSPSNEKTRTPNTIIHRNNNVHQSLLSSQKSSKDGHQGNKQPVHHPAVGKPSPSFNFRASLGNDTKEIEIHSPSREGTISSDDQLVQTKDSLSKESLTSNDPLSLVQNVSSTHDKKPVVKTSSSKPIQLLKSKVTTSSIDDGLKFKKNKKTQDSILINNFDKAQTLDENKFTDFSDYEIDDPELEEIYEEIYEFKPKPSDSDQDSGYVDSTEIYSGNVVSSQQQNKHVNKQKSPGLRGALPEKILPPPPISNSLLNHNVILTNIRARHNESTKSTNLDSTLPITTEIENKKEENSRNTINVQGTTESSKRVANNIQRGRGRSQSSGRGSTSEEDSINNIGRVEQKPSLPITVTRGPLPTRTTAAIPKVTTTTRSPVPRNLTTTTLRPIPSERGSKRFAPSSLLRQNSNLKESQLKQIEEHIKVNPKKQSINIQNAIPIIQTVSANQNINLVPITHGPKERVTTLRPLTVTRTSKPVNFLHNVNLVTVTEEETTSTSPDDDIQTTTETNDFEKKRITNVSNKNRDLVDSPPTVNINKEQNGKVRKVTRTRISSVSNSKILNIGQEPAAHPHLNIATTDTQKLDNVEQKETKVAMNSVTFRKTNEFQQAELETTVGPLDESILDSINLKKKIAIETASFRQTNPSVNTNRPNLHNDASYQENLKPERGGPSHDETIRNNERQIVSHAIDSSKQNEGLEKTAVNFPVRKVNKVVNEVVNSQVSSRRRTTSRNRGSATFNSDQTANLVLDTIRQSKSIDANVVVELPKLNSVVGNSVRQIPSKTRVVPSSKTVIISNINQINSSTSEINKNKTGTDGPIRRRIVASPQPSNSRRRGNNDVKNVSLKTGGSLKVLQNKNVAENNFAGRINLLPKISGKFNLDQLSEIEKQIQRFASGNGAQLISYTVKKNDKHPKYKNKIDTTQSSNNTTESKLNSHSETIPKLIASEASIPRISSATTSVGKNNRINSPSKVQAADITSVKKSTVINNYDDELAETGLTTDIPLISVTNRNDEKRYLPLKTQTIILNETPQSRSLKNNPEVTSVKLQAIDTTDKISKIVGSSISATLNADVGKIKPAVNINLKAGSNLDANRQPKVITRTRSTTQQSRSSIANLEVSADTTITDETTKETITAAPRVVSRSRGRSQSVRKTAEIVSTTKAPIYLNNSATEVNSLLHNENTFKNSPVLSEITLAEEKKAVTKNLRASNLEKIRNRVSSIQKNKEILPENNDEKNSAKSTENQTAGVRSPVNLLNSLRNIKSQRDKFKGGSSPVTSDSKSLTNDSLILVNIEPESDATNEGNTTVDNFQTTTVSSGLKPSLNSRRSQVRQQGRSRNLSTQKSLVENVEKIDGAEAIKVITSDVEKEIPVEATVRPINLQNNRSGRTRVRISNTQKSVVPITESNPISIEKQEVSNEQLVNDNKNSHTASSVSSQRKKITRTRNIITPTELNSGSQDNNKLKVVSPRITRKRLATQTEPTPEEITESTVNNELLDSRVNSLSDAKSENNSFATAQTSDKSIRRVSRKRVTAKNIPSPETSETNKEAASVTVVTENATSTTNAKENSLNRKRIHSQSSTATQDLLNNSDTRRKYTPALQDPLEITSNNENLVHTLNLESTSSNSARKVSRKRITTARIEPSLTSNIQQSQQDTRTNSEVNKREETLGLDANSVAAEKTPINSIRRVSRKRVTTQTKSNVLETVNSNNITEIDRSKIDDITPLVRKVSPTILDSFTTTTEKPRQSSPRKDHSSRGGAKFDHANDNSQFAHELLTDVNENQKSITGAQQYSIAVTESEANSKKKVLKKVSPARQFQQKVSEGTIENAEVFSGLKLRVVGTSVKSSISSTSKADEKKSNLDLIASASRTNTRTLTDLELDALRSLTQVNEPLRRQPGRSRNVNRRLISKRKV